MSAEMGTAKPQYFENGDSGWPRGWRPYAALFAGFCGMANCWGLIMSFGPYFRHYDEHLLPQAGDSAVGLIGSIQSFLVLALSFVVGRLLDSRLHRYVAGVGGILTTLGYLCLSFTSGRGLEGQGNYGLIVLTQGIVAGLGMSCYFVYSSQLVIQWFPRQRYFAVGVTSAGAAAGGLAYPPAISFLISGHGFPNGVRIQTAIIGAISLVIFLLGGPAPSAKKSPLVDVIKPSKWFDREAFKSRGFLLLSAAVSFIFFGYAPLLYHVTEWAEQEKLKVVWFLSIMNGCSIIGRIGSAGLASIPSKWANPLLVHTVSCFVAALTVFLFWPLADQKEDALGFCVFFGILAGSLLGLPASGVAYIIPTNRQDSLGVWTGMMWTSCCFFALAGPPIAGVLRKRYTIEAVGYWAGANLSVAGALSLLALLANRKEKEEDPTQNKNGEEGDYELGDTQDRERVWNQRMNEYSEVSRK